MAGSVDVTAAGTEVDNPVVVDNPEEGIGVIERDRLNGESEDTIRREDALFASRVHLWGTHRDKSAPTADTGEMTFSSVLAV